MDQIPEDPARSGAPDDFHKECVQELHRPYPDYAKIQALATLSVAEALREVAGRVADLSHQISLASSR